MLQGFTEQGIKEIQRHGLMFQGVDLRGELISESILWTVDLNLVLSLIHI